MTLKYCYNAYDDNDSFFQPFIKEFFILTAQLDKAFRNTCRKGQNTGSKSNPLFPQYFLHFHR